MKKKILVVMLVLATVVGLAFAQSWCVDARELISKGGEGTKTAWIRNASQSQSVEVFYEITKSYNGYETVQESGSDIIGPLQKKSITVKNTIKNVKITDARVCN